MSILMSASSQTHHSILCVVGARLSFVPEEINQILTTQAYDDILFTTGHSGAAEIRG